MGIKEKGIKFISNFYSILQHPFESFVKNSKTYKNLETDYISAVSDLNEEKSARDFLCKRVGQLGIDLTKKFEENLVYLEALKQRDFYEKQSNDRGRLIDFLKADKKGLVNLMNQVIDKTPEALTEFLQEDSYFSKQPLLFVNSHGIIIASTEALKKKLRINYNLNGKSSYELLRERYPNMQDSRELQKFFNTYHTREFNTTFKDMKNEIINLRILKEKPVLLKDIDLSVVGRNKIINPIAFIPVLVYPISSIRNFVGIGKNLEKQMGTHKKVFYDLTSYGWKTDEIIKKEEELGFGYLQEQAKILNKLHKKRK
ncbi:MAG: hypothetical protein WCX73_01430 [Candidatus Pacearchaeota archaeon]|jgi:hypothetical protein